MCNCSDISDCCGKKKDLNIDIVSDLIKKIQENKERTLGEVALVLIDLINEQDEYNKISRKRIDILVRDVAKQRKKLLQTRSGRYSHYSV